MMTRQSDPARGFLEEYNYMFIKIKMALVIEKDFEEYMNFDIAQVIKISLRLIRFMEELSPLLQTVSRSNLIPACSKFDLIFLTCVQRKYCFIGFHGFQRL